MFVSVGQREHIATFEVGHDSHTAEFYAAAGVRKHIDTYAAGHDLHTTEVAADRVAWLTCELELK